jgi:hypothetical protein
MVGSRMCTLLTHADHCEDLELGLFTNNRIELLKQVWTGKMPVKFDVPSLNLSRLGTIG